MKTLLFCALTSVCALAAPPRPNSVELTDSQEDEIQNIRKHFEEDKEQFLEHWKYVKEKELSYADELRDLAIDLVSGRHLLKEEQKKRQFLYILDLIELAAQTEEDGYRPGQEEPESESEKSEREEFVSTLQQLQSITRALPPGEKPDQQVFLPVYERLLELAKFPTRTALLERFDLYEPLHRRHKFLYQ